MVEFEYSETRCDKYLTIEGHIIYCYLKSKNHKLHCIKHTRKNGIVSIYKLM